MLHQCNRKTSMKKSHCYISENEQDLFFRRFFKWHIDYVREDNTDPVMLTYFVTYILQSRAESTSAPQECWWLRKVCERGWGWVLDYFFPPIVLPPLHLILVASEAPRACDSTSVLDNRKMGWRDNVRGLLKTDAWLHPSETLIFNPTGTFITAI